MDPILNWLQKKVKKDSKFIMHLVGKSQFNEYVCEFEFKRIISEPYSIKFTEFIWIQLNNQANAAKPLEDKIFAKVVIDTITKQYNMEALDEEKRPKTRIQEFSTLLKKQTDDNLCPICYENFNPDSLVVVTTCSHLFHYDCLEKWLSRKDKCPLCRTTINLDDYCE